MAKGIFVVTHSQGELALNGPFQGSTTIVQFQAAQIWVTKWATLQPKGEVPQWWIVEQDVADGATSFALPIRPTGA